VDPQTCTKIGKKLIGVMVRNVDGDRHIGAADNHPLMLCVVSRIPENRLQRFVTRPQEMRANAVRTTFMKPGVQQSLEFRLSSENLRVSYIAEIPEQLVENVFWIQKQIRRSVGLLFQVSVCNTSSGHVTFPVTSSIRFVLLAKIMGENQTIGTERKEQSENQGKASQHHSALAPNNSTDKAEGSGCANRERRNETGCLRTGSSNSTSGKGLIYV